MTLKLLSQTTLSANNTSAEAAITNDSKHN